MLNKFKKGDIVRVIKVFKPEVKIGDIGMVIKIEQNNDNVLIEFYKNINGHNGNGQGKEGHCYWVHSDFIEKVYQNYETLDTIKSQTSTKTYTVKRNILTGKISCNCPSWIYKNSVINQEGISEDRMCKHIKQWIEKNGDEYQKKFILKNDYRKSDEKYDNILKNIEELEKYV